MSAVDTRPYFADPAAISRLQQAWEAWEGTPFRRRWQLPKRGVDCVCLAAALLHAAGACPALDLATLPDYPIDWSAHNDASMLEDWMHAHAFIGCRCETIDATASAMAGDVLVFSPGRSCYHLGVALSPQTFGHILTGSYAATCAMSHPRYRAYHRKSWRILTPSSHP